MLVLSAHCTYNVQMSSLRIEWDLRKAALNLRKHGVSLEDAMTVFSDERARLTTTLTIPKTKRDFCFWVSAARFVCSLLHIAIEPQEA